MEGILGNEYMSAQTTMAILAGSMIVKSLKYKVRERNLQMNAWLGGQQ